MAQQQHQQQGQQGGQQGQQGQQGQHHQQQDHTVNKEDYDSVVQELQQVKKKLPHEPTEEEQKLEQQKQDLFNREVNAELKENGLEQFADILNVQDKDDLQNKIKSLSQIVNDIKVNTSYVPKDHSQDDEYSNFAKNNDTQGMIGTKLSKLFK